ncbi:WXG100 family type VII secretion target [Amycolatopsis sp. NPDC058986]|uniref:WXG100 family type VII secretion target n=1 Tax=unclassified Amycolatopsis TaxID=2618356 RepID=UPI003672D973
MQYSYDPSVMAEVTSAFQTAANNINSGLETLRGAGDRLLNDWTESAADAWHTAQAKWGQSAQDMPKQASHAGVTLEHIRETYVHANNYAQGQF